MQESVFTPENCTINQILGDRASFYNIPNYQRPYSWNNEQLDTLWDDLTDAYNNKDKQKEYFLGAIIVIPSPDSTDERFDVIDGQQRITSLIILFATLFAIDPDLDQETKDTIADCVISIITKNHRLSVKLLTHADQQNYFERVITNTAELLQQTYNKTERNNNKYLNAALVFSERIKECSNMDMEGFITYILNNVHIIRIKCSNQQFAIKLFRIINTRGLNLSEADLIKSFLLSTLPQPKHNQFISHWNKILTIIDQADDVNLDNILLAFEYYLLASNPKRSLSEEIEGVFMKEYRKEGANDFLLNLEKFADGYIQTLEDYHNFPFRYLKHQIYWRPILSAAKFKDYSRQRQLSEILKKFYYQYWIAGYTTAKIKQISFNIIRYIKEGRDISDIQKELNKKAHDDNAISRCITNLKENIFGEAWLKPLLIMIELSMNDDSVQTNFINLDRKIHIEHILPVDPTHHHTYPFPNPKEDFINKLPNLTLLSGRKNIQASNNPFKEKKECYRGKGKDGSTSFKITGETVFIYEDWNEQNYEARREWLYEKIKDILDIEIK